MRLLALQAASVAEDNHDCSRKKLNHLIGQTCLLFKRLMAPELVSGLFDLQNGVNKDL